MPIENESTRSKPSYPDATMVDRSTLNLDQFEDLVLTISRDIFATFDRPEEHSWLSAFWEAERSYCVPFGATIAHAITVAICALRRGRGHAFTYIPSDDPAAGHAVTPEERYILLTLQSLRRNKAAKARTYSMLACEGGESDQFLAAIERICIITGDISTPRFQTYQ